jgi:hypothetical protein
MSAYSGLFAVKAVNDKMEDEIDGLFSHNHLIQCVVMHRKYMNCVLVASSDLRIDYGRTRQVYVGV